MKLLALVLLLSSFSSWNLAEVVKRSFRSSCSEFFIKKTNKVVIPTVFYGGMYKAICQRFNNRYQFATLFNTKKRIPVWSAYTFFQKVNGKRSNTWKIEPQLEDLPDYKDLKEMIDSPEPGDGERNISRIRRQAVDVDYKNGLNVTRGHLFPFMFAKDQTQKSSTFTLTNIAPQSKEFNQQWAGSVEQNMLNKIQLQCKLEETQPAFIVTGVVPGIDWLSIKRIQHIKDGVNIPSHYWTAFCCNKSADQLYCGAYILHKNQSNPQHFSKITDLNKQLSGLYGKKFQVFPGLQV